MLLNMILSCAPPVAPAVKLVINIIHYGMFLHQLHIQSGLLHICNDAEIEQHWVQSYPFNCTIVCVSCTCVKFGFDVSLVHTAVCICHNLLSATLGQADNSREDLRPSRLQCKSGRSVCQQQATHTHTHVHTTHAIPSLLQSCDAALRHLLCWLQDFSCRCRRDAAVFLPFSSSLPSSEEAELRLWASPGTSLVVAGECDMRGVLGGGNRTNVTLQDSSFQQVESCPVENKPWLYRKGDTAWNLEGWGDGGTLN